MKYLLLISSMLFSGALLAEVVVIVHPSNANSFDQSSVSRIFLGKSKTFANGGPAEPINQSDDSATTKVFAKNALKKSPSQLKAYWSKLVFTGRGTPPKVISSEAEVVKLIASNPNMIGYVDASSADGSVKVVMSF